MWNNSFNHGPVKASVHHVEDHTTREASVESEQIITDHQMIVNRQIMMFVIIIDRLILMLVIQKNPCITTRK